MTPRAALVVVTLLATLAAAPPGAAQPAPRVARVGLLYGLNVFDPGARAEDRALVQGLHEHDWVLGQNLIIEARSAQGKPARFGELAGELVRLRVDAIIAPTGSIARAAREATSTIPIVLAGVADPVGVGLVASLARPGGNVTGVSINAAELSAKRLQLLKDAVPGLRRAAVLWNSADRAMALRYQEIQVAAPRLGIPVQSVAVRASTDLDDAFAAMARERPGGIVVLMGPLSLTDMPRVRDFAARHRLPAVYEVRRAVEDGGLMAYGANAADMFRRAAAYVDRILKGTKPADLPVEEPTTFELVINLRTARTLGLTIPPSLLVRADHVIQ